MQTNDEEYMTDNSVDTNDLNEVDNDDVYETKSVKGIDRTTNKEVKVKKSKPIPIKKKQIKKINKDMSEEVINEPTNEIVEEIVEEEIIPTKPKKKISEERCKQLARAREAKKNNLLKTKTAIKKVAKEVKKSLPEKTIIKEKVIYMIPTQNGFIESDSVPRLTKKELNFLENDEVVSQKELAIGKKILRKKNGSADGRSRVKTQTEKQKAATQKMLQMNKERREAKKKSQEESLGKQVKKAIVDVVSKPLDEVKKEVQPAPTKPQPTKSQYDFSTIIPYF